VKRALIILALLLLPAAANAQVITNGGNHLHWDQPAPDAATAAGYGYEAWVDGVNAADITGVSCSPDMNGDGNPDCFAPMVAVTPGVHDLFIHAFKIAQLDGSRVRSLESNTITLELVLVPAPPQNLRIQ